MAYSATEEERATHLNSLSDRLTDLGRQEEALEAVEKAVSIRLSLAEHQSDAYFPDLAVSLNVLSNRLREIGRPEEALKAVEEAVSIRRRIAEQRPKAFLQDLAKSLNNQSVCLRNLGRQEEAIKVIEEALSIFRRLDAKGRLRRLVSLRPEASRMNSPRHSTQSRLPGRPWAPGGGPQRNRRGGVDLPSPGQKASRRLLAVSRLVAQQPVELPRQTWAPGRGPRRG